jgi:hypothetical protein
MKVAQIDQKLTELRGSAEAINATLLEIELDPIRRALDDAALEGESATRWAEASRQLTQLWQWYLQLDAVLKRAAEVRGTRSRLSAKQEADLTELLEGPSIDLPDATVPVVERDLLGASQPRLRCTPDEHLTRMSSAFDEAKTVVAAIGAAWERFAGRLRALNVALKETAQLAVELDETLADELGRIRGELVALNERLASNPLSVGPSDIERLEVAATTVRRDLESVDEVRRKLDQQIEAATRVRDELADTTRAAVEAHEEVIVKIAAPEVPALPELGSALDDQLARAVDLAQVGAWRDARMALDGWTTRATALLEETRRIAAASRAPIETRNQLRGLLSAYEGKAKRLRLIEDPALAAMLRAARACLYTAPTDLETAAELVRRYQSALAEHPKTREVLM